MTEHTATRPAPVTALVPVYNGAGFVRETIDCLLSQTFSDLRVFISVDRSTDQSRSICSEMASHESCTVVTHEARLGYVGNINFCLSQVDTPLFFIMPQDDLIEPSYVDRLVRYLDDHYRAVIAYPDIMRFGAIDRPHIQPSVTGARLARLSEFLLRHNSGVAFRGIVRADRLEGVLRLEGNEQGDFAVDTTWLLNLCAYGELHRVADVQYRKRIHDGSAFQCWRTASRDEHVSAWLTHTTQCARVALRYAKTRREAELLLSACACRLLMRFDDLWPPARIPAMSDAEKAALMSRFYEMLGAMDGGRWTVDGPVLTGRLVRGE